MSIQAATPYLVLHGKADEAIAHYQKSLGATIGSLTRFGDMDQSCPEALRHRVMHAEIRIGDALVFASDGPSEGQASGAGSVSVALALNDSDDAGRAFVALAEGGTVVMPFSPAPWGAHFGALTDRFGVNWMFNCDVPKGA